MSLFTMYVVGVSVIFVRIDFGSRLPKWQMIALGVTVVIYYAINCMSIPIKYIQITSYTYKSKIK